eukprot:jgi/Tetstr1/455149/TSEL_041999.t1
MHTCAPQGQPCPLAHFSASSPEHDATVPVIRAIRGPRPHEHLQMPSGGRHVAAAVLKHHLPRHHPLKDSAVFNFADLMCKALIYNGLTGEVEPTRRTQRALPDITNEPPHSIMHLGKRPGNDNATNPSKRHKGVVCWSRHCHMTAHELAVYGINRRTD